VEAGTTVDENDFLIINGNIIKINKNAGGLGKRPPAFLLRELKP
jgi:hypothetical protein